MIKRGIGKDAGTSRRTATEPKILKQLIVRKNKERGHIGHGYTKLGTAGKLRWNSGWETGAQIERCDSRFRFTGFFVTTVNIMAQ